MKKNQKYIVAGILAIIGIIALFFLLQPSFEQEYARMSLVWKEKGLEEYLHASEKVFSLEESEISEIKSEIRSFKNSTGNAAAGELASVYSLFLETAGGHSAIAQLQASLASSTKPLCENLSLYEKMEEGFTELKQKRDDYFNAVNSFVSKYPEEARSISFSKASIPSSDESLEALLDAIAVIRGAC